MGVLSAQEVVELWETGARQHPIDRALTLLAAAHPELSRETMIRMSVGHRDELLLTFRERIFGPRLRGAASCPGCGERLEFEFETDNVRVPRGSGGEGETYVLAAGGYELTYRLPDSRDLAAVAREADAKEGRALLLERCVLRSWGDGAEVEGRSLPDEVVLALSAALDERDGQADVRLALICPACSRDWQASFDVGAYLWAEIRAQAERLLGEVDVLARAYGWREEDVLSMSPVRRRFYMDSVL